ncbi:MAG: mandelate racemase/muconate lactonizing enzyme family protein, partial [Candidatus Binatia bacterium]
LAHVVERVRRAGASAEELAALADLSPAARCALDTALLDLVARRQGSTVTECLGGAEVELDVAALLTGDSPDELAAEAALRVAAGYRCLKIKVGGRPPAAERRRVAAVRVSSGSDVALRLDANRSWSAEEARRTLAELAPFAIDFLEEPLRTPRPLELARLRREGAPIALDESVASGEDLSRYLDAGAADAIVLKAARVGGPTPVLALARLGQTAGLRVVVTDSIESSVGRSAAVHLAAALPEPHAAVGLGGAMLLERDVLADGAPPGARVSPRGPGLGVTPVDHAVEWYG